MSGWQLVVWLNLVTAAAYLAIVVIIARGLLRSHQVRHNPLAIATCAIFTTCAAHHGLHAVSLLGEGSSDLTMMRAMMGSALDVAVTASTAVAGIVYLVLRRTNGRLFSSPAMFDHATEIRYRQLAANLPDTIVLVVDTDLRYVLVDGGGLLGSGYDRAAMEGRLVGDVLTPAVLTQVEGAYRTALAGGRVDVDVVTSTGRTFRARARPLRDVDEQVIGGLLLAEDVTAQRAAQATLAETTAFNEAVLAASPDATVVVDLASSAVTWSSRDLRTMLGTEVAPAPTSLTDLVLAEDLDRVAEALAAVADLDDGDSLITRVRADSPRGHRWLSFRTTPFGRDDDGQADRGLAVVRDVTDIVEFEDRLEHASLHDPLTGLANRALLKDHLAAALTRADRRRGEVAVMFCDLDGFKRINDSVGHAAGDAVLVEVAARLRDLVRRSDTVARVGGDEFVVVLEGPTDRPGELRAGVLDLADRIRAAVARPVVHDGVPLSVTLSVGVTFAAADSRTDDLIRDADAAMYLAKARGRSRVEVFDDTLRAHVADRGRTETTLRLALAAAPGDDGPALTVAYQPVYDLTTRRLAGFEALARLTDGVGTTIAPDDFVPVAEEVGLIALLGERVLDASLEALAAWRSGGPGRGSTTMAVNLSARQVQHTDMPALVHRTLDRHGLPADALVLELTESVLVESGTSTLRQIRELHSSGVGIAIDDFGTGYASLRYLATMPVSTVKVDRSFTATMTSDRTSATIVRAIAALAEDLGIGCVVEGVETADQLGALPTGVRGQGYLLGRPAAVLDDSWSGPRAPERSVDRPHADGSPIVGP